MSEPMICAKCGKEIELGKPISFKDKKSYHPECVDWRKSAWSHRKYRWVA